MRKLLLPYDCSSRKVKHERAVTVSAAPLKFLPPQNIPFSNDRWCRPPPTRVLRTKRRPYDLICVWSSKFIMYKIQLVTAFVRKLAECLWLSRIIYKAKNEQRFHHSVTSNNYGLTLGYQKNSWQGSKIKGVIGSVFSRYAPSRSGVSKSPNSEIQVSKLSVTLEENNRHVI